MTWLDPAAGLIALGATLPVLLALYVLRLRRRTREVSSTLLWAASTADVRANVPFQRLRFSVLLLLQFLVLALLALALAQPEREGGARADRHAFLIDRSLSMRATDVGGGAPAAPRTRLDAAREAAQSRLRTLHSGGFWQGESASVMVVGFGGEPTVASGFTDSEAVASQAIQAIAPVDGLTTLAEAVDLVRSALATANPDDPQAGPRDEVVIEVFSDGRIEDLAGITPGPGERFVFRPIGSSETPNRSAVSLGMVRDPRDPALVKALARLANWDDEPSTVEVELRVDGTPRTMLPAPVTLPPATERDGVREPGEVEVTFAAISLPEGGVLEARLAPPDALAEDDAAFLVVPPARQLRLALVGADEFILRTALESLDPASIEEFTVADFGSRAADDPTLAAGFDVVVIRGAPPVPLPPGRYLVFGDPTGLPGLDTFGKKEGAIVVGGRSGHPLLRYVALDEVVVHEHVAVVPTGRGEVVIDGSEGPLVIAVVSPAQQAVIAPFDPLDSNWPFQRGFLNFVSNAVQWLAAFGRPLAEEPRPPGHSERIVVGRPGVAVVATHAGGESRSARSGTDGLAVVGPLDRVGAWRIAVEGEPAPRAVTVAMPGIQESRTDAAPELMLGNGEAGGGTASGAGSPGRGALWPSLLLAALALLVAEWWWYLRQV